MLATKSKQAIVDFDYTAKEPDELTIRKGDVIKEVVDMGGGWCQGVLGDKKGMFPDNFVKMVVPLRPKKDITKIRQCRVLFSYHKDHDDELNLKPGDVVDVVCEEEEGWWRGILHGKEGVFPSNFVEEITNMKSRNSSKEDLTDTEVKSPSLPPKPGRRPPSIVFKELDADEMNAKILCEVKYAYKAQNGDELTFEEGDVITLISKEGQDPGWWKGELNGKVGVFPDNFVVIRPDDEKKEKEEKKAKEEKAAQDATPKRQKPAEKPEVEAVNKVTPPIPGKKPLLPIKKSPSGSSSSGGLFSGLRKKLVDAVDGSSISKNSHGSSKNAEKNEKSEETSGEAFDQVERNAILPDVRATRVKAPGRRPPSVVFKEIEPGAVNGNSDHAMLESVTESSANTSNTDDEIVELKPKVREWEKHKAPWLEEMKLNQAKRTSTSPGPEQNKFKLTPDKTDDESKSCKTSPFETTPSPVDMAKSMPAFSNRFKTSPSEPEQTVTPVVRTKPAQTVTVRPQTIHTGSPSSNNETPIIRNKLPPKISPNLAIKLVSPSTKPQVVEKSAASGDTAQETVPSKQYSELLQRLEKLEALVEKQHQTSTAAIEDLRGKLQVERDMRMMLQEKLEKVSQCVMQV